MFKHTLQKLSLCLALILSVLFATTFTPSPSVHAIPVDDPATTQPADGTTNPDSTESTTENPADGTTDGTDSTADTTDTTNTCQAQAGSLSWIICPLTDTVSVIVDSLYGFVSEQLEIKPISTDTSSPVYRVWQYMRDLTNIVFIIFIIIVIYSQLTGFGINNYGIKRVLPRLIIAVIIVNLSFIICSLLVDVSNIIGGSLVNFFESIQTEIFAGASIDLDQISWANITTSIIAGVGIGGLAVSAAGGLGAVFWMLVLALLGALVSVAIGLITIGLRQGLVSVLIMISPLAFVAYLLPNTEKWFAKWKNLLGSMLIFYPMFSFLFGASRLVGWTILLSATSMFGVVVGLAIQVLPLFLAITLLQMSNTILGSISSGLNRLANPVRGGLNNWATSRAEQRRQHYLRNNATPGAKLRNYLAYRQNLRELDTENAAAVVKGRASARAYKQASSSRGRNAQGHDTYRSRPNRYTRTAAQAKLYNTRLGTAKSAYDNTLSEYSKHFHDDASKRLSNASADAYLEVMKEQFRSVNNAQSDQEYLLTQYIKASANRYKNPYEFNRLILGASGGLANHIGESSILGQVIAKSAEIEARRRREATIIMTKFGLDKPTARAMIFDKAKISDDGFEVDDQNNPVEDINYQLIQGKKHRPWPHFIGVHKKTNREITADEYNRLSAEERQEYSRVRYFDIKDDDGNPVTRVYSDEAGYMKELIGRDIAIGDPINRRYLTSLGVRNPDAPALDEGHNDTGLLRRYHSTITAAMLTTKYKEHAAEVTPMLTAQADNGYINTIGQYNIANLDSLIKAAKPGSFLQNDAYAINSWIRMLRSLDSTKEGDRFEDIFPDADIANYRNVNGEFLHGMRLAHDENGNPYWKKIDRNDPSITVEDKKNFLKHNMLSKAAAKLSGMINRNISPNVLDNMKPDGLEALRNLVTTLGDVGLQNVDTQIPFDTKLNPDPDFDIFKAPDPSVLRRELSEAKATIEDYQHTHSTDASDSSQSSNSSSSRNQRRQASQSNSASIRTLLQNTSEALAQLATRLGRERDDYDLSSNQNLRDAVDEIFTLPEDYDAATTALTNLFANHPTFSAHLGDLQELIEQYRYSDRPTSSAESVDQITHQDDQMRARLEALHQAVLNLIDQHPDLF